MTTCRIELCNANMFAFRRRHPTHQLRFSICGRDNSNQSTARRFDHRRGDLPRVPPAAGVGDAVSFIYQEIHRLRNHNNIHVSTTNHVFHHKSPSRAFLALTRKSRPCSSRDPACNGSRVLISYCLRFIWIWPVSTG